MVARPFGGCGMLSLCNIAANSLRSSAISMLCGDVPMMFTPFFWRPSARFSGVCRRIARWRPSIFAFVDVQHVFQRQRFENSLSLVS